MCDPENVIHIFSEAMLGTVRNVSEERKRERREKAFVSIHAEREM